MYIIPKHVRFCLKGSKVQMIGLIGDVLLNDRLFVKHNCIVICLRDSRCCLCKLTNDIKGVRHGHIKWLVLRGIGYKIAKQANDLELRLGFSHSVFFPLEDSTCVFVFNNNKLKICGPCLNRVSLIAGNIRMLAKVNVYKGSGIINRGKTFKLKVGKR